MSNSVEKRGFDFESGLDSLFGPDNLTPGSELLGNSSEDVVMQIPLSDLLPFHNHPFKVLDDEKMQETVESIREKGVLNPAIARPLKEGGYEIISGHRRKRACEILGMETMPVLVKELDDDDAAVIMVDSNIQREVLAPSEKAKAYRIKYEAMLHQGKRTDLEDNETVNTADKVGETAGDSGRTVQRYRRLAYLNDTLLGMVDDKILTFKAGVLLAYLTEEEQEWIVSLYQSKEQIPSPEQAKRIKAYHDESKLTEELLAEIMEPKKAFSKPKIVLNSKKLSEYFPEDSTEEEMEKVIFELLEQWKKENNM